MIQLSLSNNFDSKCGHLWALYGDPPVLKKAMKIRADRKTVTQMYSKGKIFGGSWELVDISKQQGLTMTDILWIFIFIISTETIAEFGRENCPSVVYQYEQNQRRRKQKNTKLRRILGINVRQLSRYRSVCYAWDHHERRLLCNYFKPETITQLIFWKHFQVNKL